MFFVSDKPTPNHGATMQTTPTTAALPESFYLLAARASANYFGIASGLCAPDAEVYVSAGLIAISEQPWGGPGYKLTPEGEKIARTPVVGMGVTILVDSDRQAATIIGVSPNGKRVTIQYDAQYILNGPASGEPDALDFSPDKFIDRVIGKQRWHVERDSYGKTVTISLRKDGQWRLPGTSGSCVELGWRHPYYDYCALAWLG